MSPSSAARLRPGRSPSRRRATRSRSRPRTQRVSSSAKPFPAQLPFEALDSRIRAAVEAIAGTDPNPTDPFRGLYISDDLAIALAREGSDGGLDDRIDLSAGLLGLGPLE